jgi:hypothetical protein
MAVLAYQYTSLTSITLLDSSTIPFAMVLSAVAIPNTRYQTCVCLVALREASASSRGDGYATALPGFAVLRGPAYPLCRFEDIPAAGANSQQISYPCRRHVMGVSLAVLGVVVLLLADANLSSTAHPNDAGLIRRTLGGDALVCMHVHAHPPACLPCQTFTLTLALPPPLASTR